MCNKYLNVLLVDDEYLIRDLLKKCIDWKSLGMQIVSECSSAQEALDFIEQTVPDIIITDICMPFMDGIEFSEIVLEKYPHMKIIILTGYDDFEYAKNSVKIGITDFLLKPIDDDELTQILSKIKQKIEKEKAHQKEYSQLKKQLANYLPYIKEKFFNELLQNTLEDSELNDKLSYLQIPIIPDFFQISVIEPTPLSTPGTSTEEQKLLLRMQNMKMIKKYFNNQLYIHIFFDTSHRIVILNNNIQIDLADNCEKIKNAILHQQNCTVSIGIGNSYIHSKNIKSSYKEACYALNYKVIVGKNELIHYSDIDFLTQKNWQFDREELDAFSFYLKTGMKEKAVESLDCFFNTLQLGADITINPIRIISSNIISVLLNTLIEINIDISDVFEENTYPYEQIFKIDTLPDMKTYLKTLIDKVIAIIHKIHTNKTNSLISQIETYISDHSSDSDLTLAYVAKQFFLNPSYLSRIFKQEIGKTFSEYVLKVRMEQAITFYKETHLKTYEIAEKVGIPDPNYFSTCFKKYIGLSPTDYKRTINV
jgi:two-component system response regulator YesN